MVEETVQLDEEDTLAKIVTILMDKKRKPMRALRHANHRAITWEERGLYEKSLLARATVGRGYELRRVYKEAGKSFDRASKSAKLLKWYDTRIVFSRRSLANYELHEGKLLAIRRRLERQPEGITSRRLADWESKVDRNRENMAYALVKIAYSLDQVGERTDKFFELLSRAEREFRALGIDPLEKCREYSSLAADKILRNL